MAEVVRDNTQFVTDQDAAAIAAYLKSLSSPMRISPEMLKRLDRPEPRVVVW
jgi:hypothetical protein